MGRVCALLGLRRRGVIPRWLASGIASATIPTPRAVRGAVPVNVTIPACSVKKALQRVEKQRGCRTAKVKVAERGQLLEEDLERVEAVARALTENHGAEARIRIDANAGWVFLMPWKCLTLSTGRLECWVAWNTLNNPLAQPRIWRNSKATQGYPWQQTSRYGAQMIRKRYAT